MIKLENNSEGKAKGKADIWMPIFIGDYLAATTRLSTEEHGAYFLLVMDYWRSGPPPDDDEVLRCITRLSAGAWKRAKANLKQHFSVEGGCWRNARLDVEKEKAEQLANANAKRAVKAAAARWNDGENGNGKKAVEGVHANVQAPAVSGSGASRNAPSITSMDASSNASVVLQSCPSPSPSSSSSTTQEQNKPPRKATAPEPKPSAPFMQKRRATIDYHQGIGPDGKIH